MAAIKQAARKATKKVVSKLGKAAGRTKKVAKRVVKKAKKATGKSTLTPKQRAQRKYAGSMAGIRKRAKTAKGGKGKIAKRSTATKLRRDLGLGSKA